MRLDLYIINRLLKARMSSFTDGCGNTDSLCVEDGLPRCHVAHSLVKGSMTFRNTAEGDSSPEAVEFGLVQFYANSLAAGEPMTADTIICSSFETVPGFLRKLGWDHPEWFLFNSKTGLLSDKWWHIYGHFPK